METSIIIGLLVFALVLLYFVMANNRLVALRQRCDQAFADIDVQMKQRHDLIPNLVETVKGFTAHERGSLESVVQARAAALRAASPAERMKAETRLGRQLGQVLSLAESYPDLKASGHFAALRDEIGDIENKIAAARRFLNLAVAEYNTSLEQFPGNVVGPMFGASTRAGFDLGVERVFLEEAPVVKF